MSVRDSWLLYFSVLITCSSIAVLMALLDKIGDVNIGAIGELMLAVSFAGFYASRKKPSWVKQYTVFMILASMLVAVIGLTEG